MKKFFASIFVLSLMLAPASAQSIKDIGSRLKRHAEWEVQSSVESRVNRKVDQAVNGALDKAEQNAKDKKAKRDASWDCPSCGHKGNTGNFCADCGAKKPVPKSEGWTCTECGQSGNKGKFCTSCGAPKPDESASSDNASSGWTCPECGTKGNNGKFCDECGAKKPEAGAKSKSRSRDEAVDEEPDDTPAPQNKKTVETAYAKSDFIPGDEIFFEDLMDGEQMGEFPSRWDLISGSAEVASVNGKKAIFLSESDASIEPLMNNQKSYLPDIYTFEGDFFFGDGSRIGEGQVWRSDYFIDFYDGDTYYGRIEFWPNETEGGNGDVRWDIMKPNGDSIDGSGLITNQKLNDFNHVAISFNKRALKFYINGVRIANLPNVAAANRLTIERSSWDDHRGNYITNVRLCKGAVPLYDRLSSDGRIVSYAITFETGKADLKPESIVEINRIAKLMQENPDINFEVQGHCDASGSDKVNDPLSQKRAEAIVAALVDLGIAKNRLTAVGKGSHSPLADNSTDEGRARNRRVEFVKI